MFWDAYQDVRISSATQAAETAELKAERYSRALRDLQRQVDHLGLACQAMWELLRERSDMTEVELEQKIVEIDSRDGSVDGKVNAQPIVCPSCGRKTSAKRSTCLMCGVAIQRQYPFAG